MLDFATFLFEVCSVVVERVWNFRRAPITGALTIIVVVLLFWALAITWVGIENAGYAWLTWPVLALEDRGIEPGLVFALLLVATIPAFCFGFEAENRDKSKRD